MKILQVINSLATGGAEKLLLETVPKHVGKGTAMDVLLLNGMEHPFYTDFKKNGKGQLFLLGKHSVYNPINIFKIVPYLKKYDIVHVHLFPALYWVALAKWISFSKTKIIFTEHSTHNKRRNNWLLQKFDQFIYSKYNTVIGITDQVKTQLEQHISLPQDKFLVIENGIDLSKIQLAKAYDLSQLDLPENASVLIQVSSFRFPKDQSTLIKSLPYLSNTVHLLLVGEGPLQEEMKVLAQNGNVSHRVHFLGNRMDVPNLLKTADVVILSSQYEGLSLSCIEGMASGKPFVASDVVGLKEMVLGSGILFPFGDEKKLAEALNDLLSNKEKGKAVAEKCQQKAQQFDIETMVDQHIKLYRSLYKDSKEA